MNTKSYKSITTLYCHQCGTHTTEWLRWTMAAKWELVKAEENLKTLKVAGRAITELMKFLPQSEKTDGYHLVLLDIKKAIAESDGESNGK